MNDLTKEDMLYYFEEINRCLAAEDKHGEILIVGGAALTLVYNARNSTHDIDALFHPKEDMRKIIKKIAINNNLDDDWLNDGASGFITPNMGSSLLFKYSHLIIYSLDTEPLLAMKLTSAREASHDMNDSITLMKHLKIQTQDELFAIIEKYTHTNQQTPASKFFTIEAFSKYKQTNNEK